MGIELPAELRELAARAYARWPQADEEEMRQSAEAWRKAAKSITSLAGDADGSAQAALSVMDGAAAEAARRHSNGIVAEDGILPVSAKQCAAAADRLDHAADQIGEAKVRMVRELVALAKTTDAARQVSAAGYPQALAGIDTAVLGVSAHLAEVHSRLASAINLDSASRWEPGAAGAMPLSTVDSVAPVRTPQAASGPGDDVPPEQPVAEQRAATGMTGSLPAGQAETARRGGGFPMAETSQGARGGWPTGNEVTAPQPAQAAWSGPADLPPRASTPPAPGGAYPPVAGGRGPGPAAPPGGMPPTGARPPAVPTRPSAYGRPAMPMRQPPAQGRPRPAYGQPPRPLRQGNRNAAVMAFVLHQFPIGHMPLASRRDRQLPPPPETDPAAGQRFPPQDHPQSSLVDDADTLRLRVGQRSPAWQGSQDHGGSSGDSGEGWAIPDELVSAHEPFGDLSELEWERRYLARPAADGKQAEYVWPPAGDFPEGGTAPGEPIVLEPDTVLDRLGTGCGRILAPADTAFPQRSLPPAYLERVYRRYRVVRPLPVWQSVSATWFGQPGGGLRYRTTYPVDDLVALGYLAALTPESELAREPTLRIRSGQISDPDEDQITEEVRR